MPSTSPGDSSRKRPYVSRISENSSVLRDTAKRAIDTAPRDSEHRLQTSVASDRVHRQPGKKTPLSTCAPPSRVLHCRAPSVMLAVATNPAPIKTVRWASRCEALCVDTGAKITEELCDSRSRIRSEATQQLREARALAHQQAATSLCERGLRAAELAEEHGKLKDAEMILAAIVTQLRRRLAAPEIASWLDRQRLRLASIDAEIRDETEEHGRLRRRLTSSVSANDGQRMLETPVLIRTKSLEELQADEDELGVPEGEGASSRAPGTPEPAGCQLLPPRRRVENDENVAPGEDETPAACDVVASASPERDGDSSDTGGAHGRADLRDGEGVDTAGADVAPEEAPPEGDPVADRASSSSPLAPNEVALMARACFAQSRVHTLRGRREEAETAREAGATYARMCAHVGAADEETDGIGSGSGGGREREGERGGGKRPREEEEEEEADATTTGKSAKKESLGTVDAAPREGVFA